MDIEKFRKIVTMPDEERKKKIREIMTEEEEKQLDEYLKRISNLQVIKGGKE
mgnify:CR=1 FL=1